jgi:hypothetical protein
MNTKASYLGKHWLLAGATLLLLAAIGLVITLALKPLLKPTLTRPLAELLPRQITGWTVKDQPIAETEEMKKAVGELLNFDDAVFRIYKKDDVSISVYIAYWKPGKMSSRLVAGHTPDVCWVSNGWKCLERDYAWEPKSVKPERDKIPIAQFGIYQYNNEVQNVIFWHIQNGKLVNYKGQPRWWAIFNDIKKNGLNQKGEQFFIRISCSKDIGLLYDNPDFISILRAITPLLESKENYSTATST